MSNISTRLPEDIDGFLMDLAQMVSINDNSLNYNQILNFSEIASNSDVRKIRKLKNTIIKDYDFDIDDSDVKEMVSEIFAIVQNKKESIC